MIAFAIFTLLAVLIVLYLMDELKGYLKILNYRKRGVKIAKYTPLPVYIMALKKRFYGDDMHGKSKKQMAEFDHNLSFSLENAGSTCFVYLNSNQAAKEFYAKELKYTMKNSSMPDVDFLGFFFKNGQHVQDQRAIFAKIFHYSNVVSMLPDIRTTIRNV